MPRDLSPLPDALGSVFTVDQARSAGVTHWRLTARDLTAPFRGVRTRARDRDRGLSAEHTLLQRMRQVQLLLPERAFFSLSAAAVAWQLPLPHSALATLDVSAFGGTHPTRLAGVTGHRVTPGMVRVVEHAGFRLTDPASTWAQLGARLAFRDLVAVGDAAILVKEQAGPYAPRQTEPPLATIADLADAAERRHPKRHRLLHALLHIRTGSWSRPESHVRMLLTEAGLPEPELNYNVVDEIGHWVKCVDLAYPQWRVAIEYQSAYHRDAQQYAKDVAALAELTRLGWYTVQLTSHPVFTAPHLTPSKVADAIHAQRERPLFYRTRPERPR